MPFPTALTSQQKTDLRTVGYGRKAYVIATPKSIVFQATVKDAVSDSDYASIEFDPPTTGAYTDIVAGQTVIVHTDSADIDDTVSGQFPTFAREAATTTAVLTGWLSTDLAGTDTITVLDDYRLHVRQVRVDETTSTVYLDYDDVWSALPPAIHGLQSVYVVNSSTASSIAFAPTVEAMASGASISTYAWDVGDGTITVGTASQKDITVQFPAWSSGATDGWRWVSLTATDDNGNSTVFHFQVFVGDLESADWVIQDVIRLDIGSVLADGFVASMTVGDSSTNFYNDQHITVVVDETKNGDSDAIVSNIAFVGRLKGKVDKVTASLIEAVSTVSLDYSTSYELQGYGAELSLLPLPEYQLLFSSAADDWNEVTDLSLSRAIWYALVHLTTAPTVIGFNLDTATWNSYQNAGFSLEQGSVLDSINRVASLVGASLIFARSGESELVKDARLQSTVNRSALTTVTDVTNDDMRDSAQVTIPPQKRIGRVEVTGAVFDTGNESASFLRAIAPKTPNTLGESVTQRDILLASDPSTTADTLSEIAEMAANLLALTNEPVKFPATLLDGYWFLIAHNEQWYTITYSDFQSGTSYDTNTRWILTGTSLAIEVQTTDNGIPYQEWSVDAEFEIETSDAGIANSIVFAPNAQPYDVPQMSFSAPFGSVYTPENAYGESTAYSLTKDTGSNESRPPVSPPDATPTPTPTKDVFTVPVAGTATTMNKTTINGNRYKVTVSGFGETDKQSTEVTFDAGGYSNYTITSGIETTGGNPDDCAKKSGGGALTDVTCTVQIDFTTPVTISSIPFDLYWSRNKGSAVAIRARLYDSDDNELAIATNTISTGQSTWTGQTLAPSSSGVSYIQVEAAMTLGAGLTTYDMRLDNIGVPSTAATYTDAFHDFDSTSVTAHGASKGIAYNGSNVALGIANPNYYTPSHTHVFYVTGTGAQETFAYVDTDYTGNSGSLTVCVEGTFA